MGMAFGAGMLVLQSYLTTNLGIATGLKVCRWIFPYAIWRSWFKHASMTERARRCYDIGFGGKGIRSSTESEQIKCSKQSYLAYMKAHSIKRMKCVKPFHDFLSEVN